jgi:NAD-dependent SIR2 family protein deacetylase
MKHVYRHYGNLGVTICQNCAKFKADIEAEHHYVFEHGYCDPPHCPRCQAEVCQPTDPANLSQFVKTEPQDIL